MSFDDYLIKKAAAGEYAKDFLAGMDPFGAYTSQYGQTAERKGTSEKKHRAKQMLGTAGGLVGGGLLVPSAVGGITGGVKGVAGASGGVKGKLLAGVAGAAKGFTDPVGGLLKARRAKGVTQKMVETGAVPKNLSKQDKESLQFVASQTPMGAIVGQKGGVEGLESILKGEQNWDTILRQAEAKAPGAQQYAEEARKRVEGDAAQFVMGEMDSLGIPDLKDLVDVQVVPGGLKIHPREGAGDIFKGKENLIRDLEHRARARSKDVWERELESAATNPRMEEARNQVRQARMDGLRSLDEQVGSAVSGGQASLGLGGAVGGAGAFVQYGKGRATEQEFRGRVGSPGPLRLSRRNDPMQKSASSTGKSSFLTAILAPVAIGGTAGFAAGRKRKTKTTYVDLPGKLPKGRGKTKKVKVAYVQRDFIKEAHALLGEHAAGAWPFFYGEMEKLAARRSILNKAKRLVKKAPTGPSSQEVAEQIAQARAARSQADVASAGAGDLLRSRPAVAAPGAAPGNVVGSPASEPMTLTRQPLQQAVPQPVPQAQPVVPQSQPIPPPQPTVQPGRADQPGPHKAPPPQPQAQPTPQGATPQLPATIPGQPQPAGMAPDWFINMTPEQKAMMAGTMGVGGLGAGLAAGSGR